MVLLTRFICGDSRINKYKALDLILSGDALGSFRLEAARMYLERA